MDGPMWRGNGWHMRMTQEAAQAIRELHDGE
jgi:hypothetical protein